MIINHNIQALVAYTRLSSNQAKTADVMEKLSTGLRINLAKDDAAGLAVSEKMRGQIRGLNQAERNCHDAISLVQTAEGSMNEVHAILQRMRELSVQASNDTYKNEDRKQTQLEIEELKKQIDHISKTTHYNTQNLLDKTGAQAGTFTFQIGANKGENFQVSLPDLSTTYLGINTLDISTSGTAASDAIATIDNAIKTVSDERTKIGAVQNRFEYHLNSISGTVQNLTAAESRIRDANMALEMTEFTKLNIINQSATAMLSQANQLPNGILQLLKG